MLVKFPIEERDIKEVVDEFAKLFGNDFVFRPEFRSSDLYDYRDGKFEESLSPLREWDKFDDYLIRLNAFVSTPQLVLVITTKR
jgi:hypothetical protein